MTSISFGYIMNKELLGHMLVLFLAFEENSIMFSVITSLMYISTAVYKGSLFSLYSPAILKSQWPF
jgi:hypothetical protein